MVVRPDGSKVYLSARESDVALYQKASDRLKKENLLLPTTEVRSGHNTDQARGYNYFRWRDFFNDRQIFCLGILLRAILACRRSRMLISRGGNLFSPNLTCATSWDSKLDADL